MYRVQLRMFDDYEAEGPQLRAWARGRRSVVNLTKLKATLFAEQDGRCFYCGCECWTGTDRVDKAALHARFGIAKGTYRSRIRLAYRLATLEHLRRRTDGGEDVYANAAMACYYCNSCRGERTVSEHVDAMETMVRAGTHPNAVASPDPLVGINSSAGTDPRT